jgi:hypothetical protein
MMFYFLLHFDLNFNILLKQSALSRKLKTKKLTFYFSRFFFFSIVIHRVKCSACQRPSFSGFRYKCQQCTNRTYQLCQDCFWRGRSSHQHLSTHEMKEYTYFISPNKDFRHSIRK